MARAQGKVIDFGLAKAHLQQDTPDLKRICVICEICG